MTNLQLLTKIRDILYKKTKRWYLILDTIELFNEMCISEYSEDNEKISFRIEIIKPAVKKVPVTKG